MGGEKGVENPFAVTSKKEARGIIRLVPVLRDISGHVIGFVPSQGEGQDRRDYFCAG